MADRQITLETYRTPFSADDKDANFKHDVATYSRLDPMPALDRISRNLDIPVGALVRYVLARWTTSGSDALLEVGPLVVRQMEALIDQAQQEATDDAASRPTTDYARSSLGSASRWTTPTGAPQGHAKSDRRPFIRLSYRFSGLAVGCYEEPLGAAAGQHGADCNQPQQEGGPDDGMHDGGGVNPGELHGDADNR